jgi:hypothetical protein
MNLVVALDELHKARRLVVDGEQCLIEHREVLERLEQEGRDTLEAIFFLEYLEEMQEQYVAHQDRLERQVLGLVKPDR